MTQISPARILKLRREDRHGAQSVNLRGDRGGVRERNAGGREAAPITAVVVQSDYAFGAGYVYKRQASKLPSEKVLKNPVLNKEDTVSQEIQTY